MRLPRANFYLFFVMVIILQNFPLQPESLRSRSNEKFSSFIWAPPLDSPRRGGLNGQMVPGGSESFASLYRVSTVKALYPSLEGLGVLDYSRMNAELQAFLNLFADNLIKKQAVFSNFFRNNSPELAFFEHRLSLLSTVSVVHFGATKQLASGEHEVPFRIITGTQPNTKPVFFRVFVLLVDEKWQVESLIFDGDSYEAAIKSH